MPVDTVSEQPAVVAIYVHSPGAMAKKPRPSEDRLVVGFWADGRVVWSRDAIRGGAPYEHGVLGEEKVEELVGRLWGLKLLSDPEGLESKILVDADYTVLALASGARRGQAVSSHEILELNPDLVEELWWRASPEYRAFRRQWDEARGIVGEYTPKNGMPLESFEFDVRSLGTQKGASGGGIGDITD